MKKATYKISETITEDIKLIKSFIAIMESNFKKYGPPKEPSLKKNISEDFQEIHKILLLIIYNQEKLKTRVVRAKN